MYQKSARRWPALAPLILCFALAASAQEARPPKGEAFLEDCLRCRSAAALIARLRCRFCEDKAKPCQPCRRRARDLTATQICKRCRKEKAVCAGCQAVNDEACAICLARDQIALILRCTERAEGRGRAQPEDEKDCQPCRRWRASVYDKPCPRCSEASRLVQRFARDQVKGQIERARAELAGFAFLRVAARNEDAKTRKTLTGELRLLRGKAEVGRGVFVLPLEAGGEAARGFAIKLAAGSDGEAVWDAYEITRLKVFGFWLEPDGEKNRGG